MTALEIVLTAVSGALLALVVTIIVVSKIVNKSLEKKVVDYKVLNKAAPKDCIVFLGDSLTDFYPVHEFIHDERIVNRGIANETTYDITERLKDVVSINPKLVILQAGVNDFLRRNIKAPCDVARNIIVLLEKIRQEKIEVKLVSMYPVNKKKLKISRLYLRKVNNKKILVVNEYLKKYCLTYGIDYIDAYPVLCDDDMNLNADYTIEGLHLNFNGYDALTPLFKKAIEEVK